MSKRDVIHLAFSGLFVSLGEYVNQTKIKSHGMDIVQLQLKALLRQSDEAFEALKLNPACPLSADAYKRAKEAIDANIEQMRATVESRLR
jgi:hypothetical protein